MTDLTAGGSGEAETERAQDAGMRNPRPADARLQSASGQGRVISLGRALRRALKRPVIVVLASRSADANWKRK
jgi:hypothetical protein